MDEQEKEVIDDMLKYSEPDQQEQEEQMKALGDKLRELIKKGNVAKILIRKDDHVLVNLPLNVGIVGGLIGVAAAPWALITAAIATAGFDCSVEVVKEDGEVVDLSPRKLGKKVVDAGTAVVDDIRSAVKSEDADAEPVAEEEPEIEITIEEEKTE